MLGRSLKQVPRGLAAMGAVGAVAAATATAGHLAGQTHCAAGKAGGEPPEHVSKWTKRWEGYREKGIRPGFHRLEFHESLVQFADRFLTGSLGPERVFVPLCGKSLDMVFLQRFGDVAGVEVAQMAIDEFGAEQGMVPDPAVLSASDGLVSRFGSGGGGGTITIGKYDVFDLGENWSFARDAARPKFTAAYDRASFIAIDPSLREAYAAMMAEQVEEGGKVLLLTLEYDQTKSGGPPFSVDESTARQFFEPAGFKVEVLSKRDLINEPGQENWREKHSYLNEIAFLLTRVSADAKL